ncbi:MAG: pyridine nucleotide-disulfide oxidoreductase [Piscirickettsiaceae bacterium CG_4_9_14_3_um_filter_43_564]|nr:FAD-dependent oxidoreductase [Thiomicrospira sp.]OIP94731.1 MAG: pyridine nucleotide-disulfide oxidoreductase [Thiomicrospira sp. CG2_30_44_34]PIQ03193.1 MAG: pyridine nucleotide-disulfide oxidoreductase [Piscirickettsiaceae bacterium CG18_big_fil_WC_8_21_14_2_50_44_103]PIU39468.1 MAG: pyridine nucleotide-disulfide oxidoreductase [Piscirickettsiaceae bacterium CG07_land_8_20_14_0_80_44_28]PIW58555.1 MAG: pyridine nucleotide-disulfide oxidoreductase [Piscirickettsiaceae bacterium CG12_big_fil
MNIMIIGSGFAALTAIKNLRKQLPLSRITVISPTKTFVYLPSIIWIPAGLRTADSLKIDLTNFFNRQRVEHIEANVLDILDNGRTVKTDAGDFSNDGLIIASGGRFIKKLPGIEYAITPCEGITAAETIQQKLQELRGGTLAIGFGGNPKEPSAMRGGPMFEFLFGIDTLLRQQNRRQQFKLVFFNPAPKPGKRLGDKVPDQVLKLMKKLNIETHLGHKLVEFKNDRVITEGGEIPADLILFMPGMTGPAWSANSEIAKSDGGLIKANEYCQVDGLSKTYVAGDSGSYPGPDWQAKQGHMADLQAKTATHNLVAELEHRDDFKPFKHELLCIVDTLSHGILIRRTEKGTIMLPKCRLMHYAKRFFEYWYLRQYK